MRTFRLVLAGEHPQAGSNPVFENTPEHRARAAEALGEFLDPNALEPLTEAVRNDSAAMVREAAVSALGRLNHPGGNPIIAEAFADPNPAVRRAALDAVTRVNFFREHDALLPVLADEDTGARRHAALLVGQLRVDAAVPALAGLLRTDPDASVRRSAAWALGRIGTREAVDALAEVSETESESTVLDAIEVARLMTR